MKVVSELPCGCRAERSERMLTTVLCPKHQAHYDRAVVTGEREHRYPKELKV